MIDLTRSLRHLAWADEKFFTELAAAPAEILELETKPGGATIGRLAVHIVNGAFWYRYCLNGAPWSDFTPPSTYDDFADLAALIHAIDGELLAEALVPDALMTFKDEDGTGRAMRSTLLTQACYHATEHRAQIALALDLAGYPGVIDLDEYDLWSFEQHEHHQ